jgi:hypothetical protein
MAKKIEVIVMCLVIVFLLTSFVCAKEFTVGDITVNVPMIIPGLGEIKIADKVIISRINLYSGAVLPAKGKNSVELKYFFEGEKKIEEEDSKLLISSKGKIKFPDIYTSKIRNLDAADFSEDIEITSDGMMYIEYKFKTLQELDWSGGTHELRVSILYERCNGKGWVATVGEDKETKMGVIPLEWKEEKEHEKILANRFLRGINLFEMQTDVGKISMELSEEMQGIKMNWVEITHWTPWITWLIFDNNAYGTTKREKGYESGFKITIKISKNTGKSK